MTKVLWTGAVTDLSGYGVASKEYVRALDSVGVDVSVDVRSFEDWKNRSLVDEVLDSRMRALTSRDQKAQLHVIHLTPDNLAEYEKNGKTKISYFAWETSRVPTEWVHALNRIPVEVWVPCQYLVEVCKKSGIATPAHVIPHAITIPPLDQKPIVKVVLPTDRYKFYSIFQWSERKNATGLLTAYYQEFGAGEPVCLVLKTYRMNADVTEREEIRGAIAAIKKKTCGEKGPPVLLIDNLVGAAGIFAIHHGCDCYVTMARSEGFGIPAAEAAAMGNPVIVPRYSAFLDHFSDDNAFMIEVPREIPVQNMKHISSMYTSDMVWGDPSIESCRAMMRGAFKDREAAQKKGEAARRYVGETLSYEAIGNQIKARLDAVFAQHCTPQRGSIKR
jgi:glycosyltransferase involved in cell wall biosynthesis